MLKAIKNKKFKAGALYYAVMISFIIALLSVFLILNVSFHHFHVLHLHQLQILKRNINSAFILANESPEITELNKTKIIDLYDDHTDSVSLEKTLWGGYLIVNARVKTNKTYQSSLELCGGDIFSEEHVAVYVTDKDRYLSISGKTKIKGICYLPKLGFHNSYIEGSDFSGSILREGIIQHSLGSLPVVDPVFLKENIEYFHQNNSSKDSVLNYSQFIRADSTINSFQNKCIILYSDKWISLTNKFIKGNIRIVSSKGITIDNTNQLSDIIVYAPKIEILSKFTGNVQVFATDSIIVKPDVKLLFPSMLALVQPIIKNPIIRIEENCKILGDIFVMASSMKTELFSECFVAENTEINGRIYCYGKVQLKGTVNGSVYCEGFILKTKSSIYDNLLMNAEIDFSKLSNHYSGAVFIKPSFRYKEIKWLK